MVDVVHFFIERYGLIAVFLVCTAEGESAALLGGFFAHQGLFKPWQVFVAAWSGAFLGDVLFFLSGKYFSDSSFVRKLRQKPAFAYAHRMVQAHPGPYVLLNRYIYGLRLIGGLVAGLSDIGLAKFLVLNALSAVVWACLFIGIGYAFGLGAEQVIGAELGKHERLLVALGLGIMVAGIGWYIIRKFSRRLLPQRDC